MTAMRDPVTQTEQPMMRTGTSQGSPFGRRARPTAAKSAMTKYEPAALMSP